MDKIQAKTITDKFWLLHVKNKKVGMMTHNNNIYTVKIGNDIGKFTDVKDFNISYTELPKQPPIMDDNVHDYPTDGPAYNGVWNLKFNLPLYTDDVDSKSLHAAGYYKIKIDGLWVNEFCPKLIILCRNNFEGPFKEKPSTQFDRLFG